MTARSTLRRLADLVEIQNGYAFDSRSFSSASGTPLIRIRDLRRGTTTETRYDGDYDPRYLVHAGDLLVGMDGEFACYEWRGGPALLNQRVCRIQSFKSALLPRYLFYGINQHLKEIEDSTGYTTVKHLSSKSILDIEMPIPPLADQQRIVAVLDGAFVAIAAARANTEQSLRNARELFESHLDAIFSRRGPGWVDTTLEHVLATQPRNGWSPPTANHSASGIPVLTLSSVTGFQFRGDKVKFTSAKTDAGRHYWVKNGDLLITRSNTPQLVGHVAIASGITEPTLYPDLIMRMVPASDRILTEFLYYQMRTSSSRGEITGRAQGANTTMKKITKGAVQSLPIAVPPLPDQKDIVGQLQSLSSETQRLASIYQCKLDALDALKQSLLHQAFTGAL